jgi:integrase
MTFVMPEYPGKAWWRFFKRIKLRHLCYHCLRVSFVTRCQERGISKDDCMRLVGHASEVVHNVYGRLSAGHQRVQELRRLLDDDCSPAA